MVKSEGVLNNRNLIENSPLNQNTIKIYGVLNNIGGGNKNHGEIELD